MLVSISAFFLTLVNHARNQLKNRHILQLSIFLSFVSLVSKVFMSLNLPLESATPLSAIILALIVSSIFDFIFFYALIFILNTFFSPKLKSPSLLLNTFITSIILFIFCAEIAFWLEFHASLNFIAVDYLIYTTEVIQNIWQSYPTGKIILSLIIISFFINRVFIDRILTDRAHQVDDKTLTKHYIYKFLTLTFCISILISSEKARSVLSQNPVLKSSIYPSEIADNGMSTFVRAFVSNEIDYDQFYIRKSDLNQKELSQNFSQPQTATFFRSSKSLNGLLKNRPKHVILISIESLSEEYLRWTHQGNPILPNLLKLKESSVYFERFFATGTRTVRGLEALSLGIPPIPGQSVVRRPDNNNLKTLGSLMQKAGIQSFFMYGGNGFFDNMTTYFEGNHYRVFDKKNIGVQEGDFSNAWGISDEYLFRHALKKLKEFHQENPSTKTFTHIMTTSNHRPYTYPQGRIDISPGTREGALKYTDWSISDFLKRASREWKEFDETLFIITADHCASVAGRTSIPAKDYHIPLFFYAPKMLERDTDLRILSQIDIPPTIYELLTTNPSSPFEGRSLIGTKNPGNRAFLSNYQELGYLEGDRMVVLGPNRKFNFFTVDLEKYNTWPTATESHSPWQNDLLSKAVENYQQSSLKFTYKKYKLAPTYFSSRRKVVAPPRIELGIEL